jgi:hypothetical protein
MNPWSIFLSIIFSSIGLGYFLYGKRAGNAVAMGAGLVLMIFSYFINDAILMCLAGAALMAAPFLADRLGW